MPKGDPSKKLTWQQVELARGLHRNYRQLPGRARAASCHWTRYRSLRRPRWRRRMPTDCSPSGVERIHAISHSRPPAAYDEAVPRPLAALTPFCKRFHRLL